MKLVRNDILGGRELYDTWIDLSMGTDPELYVYWIPLEDAMLDIRFSFGINLGSMT